MSSSDPIPFRPWDSIRSGWEAIRPQYWLFFALHLLTLILSSAVPLVLVGPCYCGLYLCAFKALKGERFAFEDLWKGFDVFVESLLALLIQIGVCFAVFIPLILAGVLAALAAQAVFPAGTAGIVAVCAVVILVLIAAVLGLALRIGFLFVLPLIAALRLKPAEAFRESLRIARRHWPRLILFQIQLFALLLLGMLACYVGLLFVLPILFAAEAAACRSLSGKPLQR